MSDTAASQLDQSKKRKLEDSDVVPKSPSSTTPLGYYAFVMIQEDNHRTWTVPVEVVSYEIMTRIKDAHDEHSGDYEPCKEIQDNWNFAINYIENLDEDYVTHGNRPIYGPLAEVLIFVY